MEAPDGLLNRTDPVFVGDKFNEAIADGSKQNDDGDVISFELCEFPDTKFEGWGGSNDNDFL